MANNEFPKISIIVACLNEELYIEKCINSLIEQDYKGGFDIIISDGGSTDNTLDIIQNLQKTHHNIILIHNPNKYQSYGRNLAIEKSTSQYIAYLDAHRFADKSWLHELWDCYYNYQKIDEKIAGVGSVHYDAEKSIFSKAQEIAFRSILSGAGSSNFLNINEIQKVDHSCMMIYNKKIIIEAGLYNTKLNFGEDIELNHRLVYVLGYNLYQNPKSINYYYPRKNLNDLFIQQYNYGLWRQIVFFVLNSYNHNNSKKLSIMRFKTLVPALFLSILIILLLLTIINPIFFLLDNLIFLFYITILLITSSILGINNRVNPLILFAIFINIHFAYGFGVISFFMNKNR